MAQTIRNDSAATLAGGRKGFIWGASLGALAGALIAMLMYFIGAGAGGPVMHMMAGAVIGGLAGTMIGALASRRR